MRESSTSGDDDDDDGDRNRIGNEDNTREEGGEGGEEEGEDPGYLKEGALGIAIKVVPELDLVKELSSLKFLACGGYNYVWRVTYILMSEIDRKTFAYTQASY